MLNFQRQCFEGHVETDVKNLHRPQARREKLQHLELWKKLNAGQLYQAGLLEKNTDPECRYHSRAAITQSDSTTWIYLDLGFDLFGIIDYILLFCARAFSSIFSWGTPHSISDSSRSVEHSAPSRNPGHEPRC
jgi:hypothetical protein